MIISKKKYQEKIDLLEGYKKRSEERREKIYKLSLEKK